MKRAPNEPKVVVTKDGPYQVSGHVPLAVQVITPNAKGESWDWVQGRSFDVEPTYELCRCGHSKTKPFCDDSHKAARFKGTETASRAPFARQAETLDGPTLTLHDAETLCAFARFCDPEGKIWSLINETGSPKVEALVIREANRCPSGRLVVSDTRTHKAIEHPLPPEPKALPPSVPVEPPIVEIPEKKTEIGRAGKRKKKNFVSLRVLRGPSDPPLRKPYSCTVVAMETPKSTHPAIKVGDT